MKSRWKLAAALALGACAGTLGPAWAATIVFVNELHYDNVNADTGEAVEIAGPAGTDLAGWTLAFYNGSNGGEYGTRSLEGRIPDQQGGFGVVAFEAPGIQNGPPDAVALVDPTGGVVQFLSYEGTFTAADGPAQGLTSTDIGVEETGITPVGHSLQLVGVGSVYEAFLWAEPGPESFGQPNGGQLFGADPVPAPAPATLVLFGSGLVGLAGLGRKRKPSGR